MEDKTLRGRIRVGIGERAATHKLTATQVWEAANRWAQGDTPGRIAKDFSVSSPSIQMIVKGKAWKHLFSQQL